MTIKYTFEKVNDAGTHSASRDLFKFMCDNGYTNHKFEEYTEAQKKCVYDPCIGTTCPELEAIEELVDNFIETFDDRNWILLSIYPEDNIGEDGNYTKEYRNRYIYDKTARLDDILNRKNYICAAINY